MGVSSWPLLLLPVLLLLHLCLDSHQPCLRTTCVSGDDMNFLDTRVQSCRSSVDISFQRGKQGGDFLGDGSGGDAARVMQPPAQPMKKSRRGPRSKSSQYRGVTFYRRTCISGGFDTAHAAARAYDRAAVKFRGLEADINFIISDYGEDIKQRKLCKYFGDRDLVSREIIHDIKELLCKRLAGGELRWSS